MTMEPEIDRDFVEEVGSCLGELEKLECDGVLASNMDELYRLTHTIKGAAGLCGYAEIERLAHGLEAALSSQKDPQALSPIHVDTVLTSVTAMRTLLARLQNKGETGPAPAELLEHLDHMAHPVQQNRPSLGDVLISKGFAEEVDLEEAGAVQLEGDSRRLGEILVDWGRISQEELEEALSAQSAPPKSFTADQTKMVLERCVSSLYEGVTPKNMLFQNNEKAASAAHCIRLGRLWGRLRAMLEKLTAAEGKEVRTVENGSDILISLRAMRVLMVTLSQLTRNAVIHGFETPEERLAANKPKEGVLLCNAKQEKEQLTIELWDDGQGINVEALRKRAQEQGRRVPPDTAPLKEQWALIFAPSLSTANRVTSVAGLGVGMGAVTRALDACGGTIEVVSSDSQGTGFRIILPV